MNKRIVKVVIVSPSDVVDERKILLQQLEAKFKIDGFSDSCNSFIEVRGWEHLPPQIGHPQDIIIRELIEKADLLVAVFKHKLGTPVRNTDGSIRSESGTAEEIFISIERCEKGLNPQCLVYYYETPPDIGEPIANAGWEKLSQFKESVKNKLIYKLWGNSELLLWHVCRDIAILIKDKKV